MSSPEFPSFIAGSFVGDFPMYGSVAHAIGCLFVERADANSRSRTVSFPTH